MIYSCVYSWVVGFPLSQHVPRTLITRNFSTSSPASTMACAWSGARGKPSNRQPFSFTSSCNKRSWKRKRGAGPQGGRIPGGQQIICICMYIYIYIRRPLPSFGLGGAAPGITVGVQHGPVPALSFSMAPSKLQKLQKLLSGTFSATLPVAFDGLSLLCHGSSRGPTSCFCWASKLLSGTSEAPQAVSIGFRNCYLARFQHPLKASKPSKPSQQPSTAFRCFAMGPPEAPRAVSVGLRKCYLTLPRRHELFLLGFETAIWHVAAFDGHSLLCHGSSRGPTSCFCWASKLLSDTSEAPQAVSIGLRNCYLARFQHPLKASKPSKPSQQLSTAFAALPWVLPRPHELFLLGFETAIWPFRSATRCFYWASKLLSGTFSAPLKSLKTLKTLETLAAAFDGLSLLCHGTSRGPKLFLLGFETAIWHFRSATSCFYWASKLLSGTFSAPLKSLKTLPAAFDGLSLLCHGSSRGPTSCFCWASKLLSGTSEARQAVSIGLRNCYLARCSFRRPFAALPWVLPRPHKLFLLGFETAIWHFRSATSCFYIGLRNCYLAPFQHP